MASGKMEGPSAPAVRWDPYEVLCISRDSSDQEIKSAYRKDVAEEKGDDSAAFRGALVGRYEIPRLPLFSAFLWGDFGSRGGSEDGNRRRESYVESYRQLGRSFLDLQHAADRIFDAFSQRTAQERNMLTEISRRIQLAKAKIDEVSCSELPVTITSPSQYPSSCISEKDFQPLLCDESLFLLRR